MGYRSSRQWNKDRVARIVVEYKESQMNQEISPLLKSITLDGFLSFGPKAVTVPLTGLNMIIGPNGSGKSNFIDERVEDETAKEGESKPYFYFGYENGQPMLNISQEKRRLQREDIDPTQSILSQRRDPESYPEVTRVADFLRGILVYRSWSFGPNSALRMSCAPDVRTDYLLEDFSNLPARLAVLKRAPEIKKRIIALLGELAPGFDDLEIVPEGGQLQLYLAESGRMFPARRLSDGSLRFLCLLAILLDPTPRPLVVIEEPELGLHPDILPTIRDLMVEACVTRQLIVTTHSTQLLDAMTDHAASVLICEKEEGNTCLTRLSQDEVEQWREHGGLGDLWMSGHIGGTRW